MRILVFGDSIAQGYYDTEQGGWVNLLSSDIMKRKARRTDFPTECFNMAVSGNFTQDVIKRFEFETEHRRWGDESIKLIFAVGINDSHVDNSIPVSSPEKYQQNLEELYAKAKGVSSDIAFIGLTPVDETETRPWLFNTGTHILEWNNDRIREFDKVLESFAQSKDAVYIPLFVDMLQAMRDGAELMMDGLHPDAKGHVYMYSKIKERLTLGQASL